MSCNRKNIYGNLIPMNYQNYIPTTPQTSCENYNRKVDIYYKLGYGAGPGNRIPYYDYKKNKYHVGKVGKKNLF